MPLKCLNVVFEQHLHTHETHIMPLSLLAKRPCSTKLVLHRHRGKREQGEDKVCVAILWNQ